MQVERRWTKLGNILGILIAVVLLGSICRQDVFAAQKEENLKTVRVGYLIYDGFQEGKGDEPKSGYGYEYLQQIAYYAGWKYEYVNGSFSELLQMLKDGEIDIMGNISYTEERARDIDYATEEQGREYYYLFVREDRTDISTADLSTMNGMNVGINKGSIQADLFDEWCRENQLDVNIILYEDSQKRYEDMNNGTLDATVSTNVAAKDIVNFHWNSLVKIGSSPYYFATNKDRPDILQDLNDAIYKILQSDWYYNEKVYLKYYGKASASSAGLNQADLKWAKEKKVINVGYMDNTLPYADKDEDSGELIGLLSSFLNSISEQYDVKFDTKVFVSYEQMKTALENGEIDTMFPVYGSYWIAEENQMMVTDALAESQILMVYSDNTREDLTSVIAITDMNPMQQFYVAEHYQNSEVIVCDSLSDCIRAVMDGKATCTLMSSDFYYANRNEIDSLGEFMLISTGYTASAGFGVRKDKIDTYSFMKKCVTSLTETEINEALLASRHVKSEQSVMQFLQQHVMMVLVVVGNIFVLIISFFGYYVISSRKALRLARSNIELNEKAFIDFATGLPNKNKCEEMLSSPCPISRPTACYMLDLNDLKVVNDTLGHEMGDLMILNFAKLLRQTVPLQFFVGRFGGDEFIVIAENIRDQEEAEQLKMKIRDIVLDFNGANGKFKLKYACGYAFSGEFPSCNMMELLNVADQRMYEDKKRGKNGS